MLQSACLVEEKQPARSAGAQHRQVVCVCGGFGFPRGTGSSVRIIMVGKALQEAGMDFRLFHCGPSPLATNKERSGVFEGIPFEYTTAVRRPVNALARSLVYLWGLLVLGLRLVRLKLAGYKTAIWLYILDGPANLYVGRLCRLLGLPVVQELCEWWPGWPECSAFTKWLYRGRLFQNATGALVISRLIEERVQEAAAMANPGLRVYRLPPLVDLQRFLPPYGPHRAVRTTPAFLWCGAIDMGWHKDVLFVIRSIALLQSAGHRAKLIVVGACSRELGEATRAYAQEQGLAPDQFVLTGYLEERSLNHFYCTATALLLPLRDDDRSRTRVPNKLGEYLASGRPVVTCRVGDLTDFLMDGVNAYLAEPGDERSFADRMCSVLRDPAAADRIGMAGRRACAAYLDYRIHVNNLAKFFEQCISRSR